MKKYVYLLGMVALVASFLPLSLPAPAIQAAPLSAGNDFSVASIPGELLVTYAAGLSGDVKNNTAAAFPLSERDILGGDTELWTVPDASVAEIVSVLKNDPTVADVSLNEIIEMPFSASTEDPLMTSRDAWGLWGARRSLYGSRAEDAWANGYRGSSETVVAVIDSGFDVSHPDLKSNMWVNNREIPNNGVDADKNGYIDDVHGWSFPKDSGDISHFGSDGHGTHVAGTIGAVGGNGIGISGVAPNVKMVGVQIAFPDPDTGTQEEVVTSLGWVVKSLDYITELKKSGVPITAVNGSFTTGYNYAVGQALNRLGDQNILFIGAAGNSGFTSFVEFPASYLCTTRLRRDNCVIPVTAHYNFGAIPPWANSLKNTMSAPGSGILSTEPGGKYGVRSGTSMAAPHVTGAVALCTALEPNVSLADKRNLLLSSLAPPPTSGTRNQLGVLDVSAYTARCGPHRIPEIKPLAVQESVKLDYVLQAHGRSSAVSFSATTLPAGLTLAPYRQTRWAMVAGSRGGQLSRNAVLTEVRPPLRDSSPATTIN